MEIPLNAATNRGPRARLTQSRHGVHSSAGNPMQNSTALVGIFPLRVSYPSVFPSFAKPAECEQARSMKPESLSYAFAELSTPLVAPATLRLNSPLGIYPTGIHAVT